MMLLPFMAEFFNSHQNLFQDTNWSIFTIYIPLYFNIEMCLKFNLRPLHLLNNFVKEIQASDSRTKQDQ